MLQYRIHPQQITQGKRKQQALSSLAAQAAARMRIAGKPDPLDLIQAITPALLSQLGISEVTQHTTVASYYLTWIRAMCNGGEYSVGLDMADEMLRSCDCDRAERWTFADAHLTVAKMYWRQHKVARSMLAAMRGVMTRPAVVGRPLKPVLRYIYSAIA